MYKIKNLKRHIPVCKYYLILVIVLLLTTCQSEQSTETEETFSGITVTGADSPETIGNIDADDWKNNIVWKYNDIYLSLKDSIEESTFAITKTINDTIPVEIPADFNIQPAYPNPISSFCYISFDLPALCEVFIVIIDKSHNIVAKLMMQHLNAGRHAISFIGENEQGMDLGNDIYRCIYRFEDKMTGEYGIFNGHGDIQINR